MFEQTRLMFVEVAGKRDRLVALVAQSTQLTGIPALTVAGLKIVTSLPGETKTEAGRFARGLTNSLPNSRWTSHVKFAWAASQASHFGLWTR